MSTTLAAGSSVTVSLDPFGTITLVVPGKASLTVTSGAENLLSSSRVTNARSQTYGPYGVPVDVTITAVDRPLEYTAAGKLPMLQTNPITGAVSLMSEAGILDTGNGAYASYYLAFFPLDQPVSSGPPRDTSANVETMYRLSGLSDAACWANPGWATTGAGSNLGLMLNASDVDLSATDTRNILIAFDMLMAAPGSTTAFAGWSAGSGFGGLIFSATSAGKLQVSVRTAANTTATSSATVFSVADGTRHSVIVLIDNVANALRIFVDGVLDRVLVYGTTVAHHTVPQGSDFGFGAAYGADQTTVALQVRYLHMLALPAAPANLGQLARELHNNMGRQMFARSFREAGDTLWFITVGQSNEADNGSGPYTYTHGALPRTTLGGYFPKALEKLAARRNVSVARGLCAVGSTSIAHDTCGYCRTFVPGILVAKGSYVLSDGGLWKADNAAGNQFTCTAGPTGTTNTTTDGGTRSWIYVGVPGAGDVDGTIYRFGSPRFDPNNYLTNNSYGGIATAVRQGWSKIVVAIAYGQQDSIMSTPRAQYALAYQALIDMFIEKGATDILVGQSFYAPTADAWVTSNLIPALSDVMAAYAGDPRVQFGVDLRTALGAITGTPAAGKVGRQGASDPHGNDPAIDAAGELWYQRIVDLGMA